MRHIHHLIAVPFVYLMAMFPGNTFFRIAAISFGHAEAVLLNKEIAEQIRPAFNYIERKR